MKNLRIFIAIIALTLTGTISKASTGMSKVVIRETAKQMVNLKSSLESEETLRILISQDGEIILEDVIGETKGLVSKTYDFNEARFGDYSIEVFINDELVESTVIGEKEISYQNQFTLEVY